jgi:alkylated DNA repair dioxygenase AlkB
MKRKYNENESDARDSRNARAIKRAKFMEESKETQEIQGQEIKEVKEEKEGKISDKTEKTKLAKITEAIITPTKRAQAIIDYLVKAYKIDPDEIQVVGTGDSVYVPKLLDRCDFSDDIMEELSEEFNWLDPSDERAARNRAGQELGRVKACLRKYRVDEDGVVWKPRYGHYTGAVPLHKFASGELCKAEAPVAFQLCEVTDKIVNQETNHIIGTRYRNEDDNIAPHSDKYADLEENSYISSWSFGTTRDLVFEPVDGTRKRFKIALAHGAFFTMGPETNAAFKHSVPKSKTPIKERMSCIFRAVKTYVKSD